MHWAIDLYHFVFYFLQLQLTRPEVHHSGARAVDNVVSTFETPKEVIRLTAEASISHLTVIYYFKNLTLFEFF
jgi:hypothetical protein